MDEQFVISKFNQTTLKSKAEALKFGAKVGEEFMKQFDSSSDAEDDFYETVNSAGHFLLQDNANRRIDCHEGKKNVLKPKPFILEYMKGVHSALP